MIKINKEYYDFFYRKTKKIFENISSGVSYKIENGILFVSFFIDDFLIYLTYCIVK